VWGLAAALLAIVRAMPEAGGTRTLLPIERTVRIAAG
jgi:hypothetical protein